MKSLKRVDRVRESRELRRKENRELKRKGADYSPAEKEASHRKAVKEIAPLRALTEAQGQYIASIIANDITFSTGPQGTGKSYVAGAFAAEQLKLGVIDKLIITRPGVEAGRNWGALPGELEEKFSPFMEPFVDVLTERLGKNDYECMVKNERIVAMPLEFMRGKTFNDTWAILDEAQNATEDQIIMFMTRIGNNSKLIIDGSVTQCDIRNSGLKDAIKILKGVYSIGSVEFEIDDIVRNGIIKDILLAYEHARSAKRATVA